MRKSQVVKSLLLSFGIVLTLSSCASMEVVSEGTKIVTDAIFDIAVDDDAKRDALKTATNDAIDKSVKVAEGVPPETEYAIGRSAAGVLLQNYKLYDNPEATEYLNKICTTLTINSPRPYMYKGYFVAVLDSDEINAISTPGGHIFISKGLLDCTNSEDAVAAVIAHELSHIQLGHSKQAIEGERGMDAATSALSVLLAAGGDNFTKYDVENLNNSSDSWARTVLRNGFSKSQEYDADANAIKLLRAAGYNPYALIDMLEAINVDSGHSHGGWEATHPSPKKRIKEAQKILKRGNYKAVDMEPRKDRFNQFKVNF